MNTFRIGDTEFGIGEVGFSIEDGILELEIAGDEEIFEQLVQDDDSGWSWALYEPQIYFRGIPFEGKDIIIDEVMPDSYEIALYMMEHNDFTGKVSISDSIIKVSGKADIMGEVYPVSIVCRLE